MTSEPPKDARKGKPIGITTQKEMREEVLGLVDTVEIDSKIGALTGKDPKKTKATDLIGPR